jgi:hypothetical protein
MIEPTFLWRTPVFRNVKTQAPWASPNLSVPDSSKTPRLRFETFKKSKAISAPTFGV